MREPADLSGPTRNYVTAHARAPLIATYGQGAVRLPSPATAYRILDRLERRHPLFSKSTKRNRDIAVRPVLPYGKLHPSRPGEYLLMDTNHLDVFAMDPHTLRWVGVDLTVGMGWYSRCITGLCNLDETRCGQRVFVGEQRRPTYAESSDADPRVACVVSNTYR